MEYQMKHFLRDAFIVLVDAVGISAVYRSAMHKKGPLVRVLCFHDVANAQWFKEVIGMLVREFNVITPEQFNAKSFSNSKVNLLITFDDGYMSWVDTCLPILEAHNVKALFFVNSGILDVSSDKTQTAEYFQNNVRITPKESLTWEGARELVAQGHTLGGHTVHHVNLAECNRDTATLEIVEDKKRHEDMLGIRLNDFAYPFGTKKHFTSETAEVATKAGYARQYSAITGFVESNLAIPIPRTLLEKDQPLAKIRSWVRGGYDIFNFIKI
jgi:peptidoglycan/xylan/chitin deacetylase (PgdA/CDA1 family)